MPKNEKRERKTSAKKGEGSGPKTVLRSVVGTGVATDTLLDFVERLGLVDIVLGRVKSRIAETDVDELLDDVTDYLRRNPEVLVVSLGAVTAATGLLVWLNNRREWDGRERRDVPSPRAVATAGGSGRARRESRSEQ
jgi:hypothetical protein